MEGTVDYITRTAESIRELAMGCTVNYSITTTEDDVSEDRCRRLVGNMRDQAMRLFFDKISMIKKKIKPKLQQLSVPLPWNKKHKRIDVDPIWFMGFTIDVGWGCESLEIGLCKYPKEVTTSYRTHEDGRFFVRDSNTEHYRYSHIKHNRYLANHHNDDGFPYEGRILQDFEKVTIPTGIGYLAYSGLCKTEYAGGPKNGGTANFMACHLSVISLLERIDHLRGLKCGIDDGADFGPNLSCPEWRIADAGGQERKYRAHKGNRNIADLIAPVRDLDVVLDVISELKKKNFKPFTNPYLDHLTDLEKFDQLWIDPVADQEMEILIRVSKTVALANQIFHARSTVNGYQGRND